MNREQLLGWWPLRRMALARFSPFPAASATMCLTLLAMMWLGACGEGSSVPPPPPTTAGTVQMVETTGDQSQLLALQPTLNWHAGNGISNLVITINEATVYQTMDGFGASLTDSSASLIWNQLSSAQQSALMQQLFSPSTGIGISFLRQPMGASDFSASGNYSYDDMPAGQTDTAMANFSIAHDTAYILPLLKQALSLNPALKVVGLPWSPPAWMKTSGTMNGGNINPAYYASLAQYFVLFVQAYQQQGVPIYAVSPQNEPLNSNTSYPTAYLAAADETTFVVNYLGPALQGAGLSQTKIFAYEHNWDHPEYAQTVLGSSAGSFVAGSSFHCYAGDESAQTTVETAYPAKDIWFTECSGTAGSSFAGDLVWNAHHLLIGATRNWARSVSLWNLALDQNSGPTNGGCMNCRGVVTIDRSVTPAKISFNVEYYVLGHLAKFVTPGAKRIDSNTFGMGSIEDVAFHNPDGSKVLLVLNSGQSAGSFSVQWNGQAFESTLAAGALATYNWK